MKKGWFHSTFWMGLLLFGLCSSLTAGAVVNAVQEKTEEKKIPVYSVETEEKQVALTFDCAWNVEDLDSILATLEKNQVKAAFFVTGEWAEQYPQAVKTIVKAGHDIGNHGDGHKHMNALSLEECRQEIFALHKKVFELTGVEMTLFRPPYGEYNNTVITAAEETGYYSIQWDVDSLDWKNYGKDQMINQVLENQNLQNGSIILLHNGTMYTAQALQGIIDGLTNQGYRCVPVSELIYKQNYEIDHTGRQRKK